MNVKQAKKFSNAARKVWKFKKIGFFLKVIKLLYKSSQQKTTKFNEFEFSLINKEPKLRVLHIFFWRANLSLKEIGIILKKRELFLIYILKYLKHYFGASYNLFLFHSFIEFNYKNGQFPVQYGMEFCNDFSPKIKIYLSINCETFNLKNFCSIFKLDYIFLKKEFDYCFFDAVGIDLLPDGKFYFKFYPLRNPQKGELYRIDKKSRKISVKFWERFPQKLTLRQYNELNYMKLPIFVKNILKSEELKISYLSIEKKKRSLYFR